MHNLGICWSFHARLSISLRSHCSPVMWRFWYLLLWEGYYIAPAPATLRWTANSPRQIITSANNTKTGSFCHAEGTSTLKCRQAGRHQKRYQKGSYPRLHGQTNRNPPPCSQCLLHFSFHEFSITPKSGFFYKYDTLSLLSRSIFISDSTMKINNIILNCIVFSLLFTAVYRSIQ